MNCCCTRVSMKRAGDTTRWLILIVLAIGLSVVLCATALHIFRELDAQRQVYLREHAVHIAARMEVLTRNGHVDDAIAEIRKETKLRDLQVIRNGAATDLPALASIWNGDQLYREETRGDLYRVYIPFHSAEGLEIACMELDPSTADFLIAPARHNIIVSALAALALVILSSYIIWSARRSMILERRHMKLEHLAQLGQMSSMLAHEIRDPLGTIKGFAELALEKSDLAIQPLVRPIVDESCRLENLVRDLLAFGRPPAPMTRVISWNGLLQSIETHVRQMIGTREVRWIPEASPIRFETDFDMLLQVLLNLVKNAIDAAAIRTPGEVRLFARILKSGACQITIRDNGPGIREQDRLRIFEPFYTTKSFGTGLGLPISQRLTHLLGGDIELRRSEPCGTDAVVTLRNCTAEPDPDEVRPAKATTA